MRKLLFSAFALSIFGILSVAGAQEEEEKVLNVYNWSDYIGPNTLRDFTTSTGIKVNYDTYTSNESLLAKIQAGATGYDVIFPSDYMVGILQKMEMLAPLDKSKLPNISNTDPKFLDLAYDKGNRYSVPYQWGTTGIGVRIDKIKVPIQSWSQLLVPPSEASGRLAMLNDMREVMGMALKSLGFSVNDTDPAHIEAAKNLLLAQKSQVKMYDSAMYKDHLGSGEVWLSQAWSGDVSSIYWKGNRNVRFIMPQEGGVIWVDNVCITKGAPHKDNAHKFINFLLNPRTAADVTNYTYYASPSKAARQFIAKDVLEDKSIYPPDSVLKRYEFIQDVGKVIRLYDQAWVEIKAN